jgi:hypothetical protein
MQTSRAKENNPKAVKAGEKKGGHKRAKEREIFTLPNREDSSVAVTASKEEWP